MMETYKSERRWARPESRPLSIGIVTADSAIGVDEALRRIRGAFAGTMQSGPAIEAIAHYIDFRPYDMSGVMPWLSQQLACLRGNWHRVFAGLCKMNLRSIPNISPCRWCGSRKRFDATNIYGESVGVVCCNCGNATARKPKRSRRLPR
jgi:hypothetical protein